MGTQIDEQPKRILVVGAGVSGLCAVKSCLEAELEPVALEQSDDIGGLWRYKSVPTLPGEGSVMRDTTINTSKEMMAFSDFPPPADFYTFMHHSQVMDYLRLYADHFNLQPHVRLQHRVQRIQKSQDYDETGRWEVTYKDISNTANQLQTEIFDGVMLCSGHHTYPYSPTYPGQDKFSGKISHSHTYRTTAGYEDKTVVVVGMGNSAVDIAVGLGHKVAKKVYLSARRRVWVYHRNFVYGLPYDVQSFTRIFFWLHKHVPWVSEAYATGEINRRCNHYIVGINPDQGPFSTHPTVNDDLPRAITSGAVLLRRGIARFENEHDVLFTDGTRATGVDNVILATGYTLDFPFLEEGVVDVREDNEVTPLYKHMFPVQLKHHTLAVIGLIQPFGAIQSIAELQSRVFVQVFLKNASLPCREDMLKDAKSVRQRMATRYAPSRRHTFQVDGVIYMDEIADIMGAKPPGITSLLRDGEFKLLYFMYLQGAYPYQYRLRGPHSWPGAKQAIYEAETRSVVDPYQRIEGIKPESFYSFFDLVLTAINVLMVPDAIKVLKPKLLLMFVVVAAMLAAFAYAF